MRDDPGGDVDGDAGEVLTAPVALAGVDAGTDLDAQLHERASLIARAARMAFAGPSNTARKPSPSVLIGRPP